jgi:hypothetical protein
MEQTHAAATAASTGEVHPAPDQPAIFEDPSALQVVFSKLDPRDLCTVVQVSPRSACLLLLHMPSSTVLPASMHVLGVHGLVITSIKKQ